MTKYEKAQWIPWQGGSTSAYRGLNRPEIIVIHIQQGYASTAKQWAQQGFTGASWHFTNGRDGGVMQHLEEQDGGFHAGISRVRPDGTINPNPTFKLWKGWAVNCNTYSIGIENEGFSGNVFPEVQIVSLIDLLAWLCKTFSIPADRDHIIGHYEIALIDRPNDPGPTFPWDRVIKGVKEKLGEDDMAEADRQLLYKILTLTYGSESEVDRLLKLGVANLEDRMNAAETLGDTVARANIEKLRKELADHKANHPSGGEMSGEHKAIIKFE